MKKLVIGILVVLLVAAGAYWFAGRDATEAGPVYETIVVAKGDVQEIVSGSGTIEPASTTTVRVARAGVITSVSVTEGAAITNGAELFRVDGTPVFALVTPTPFYRTLASGDDGDDVRVLQELMRDLDYYSGTIDSDYGGASQEAVRDFLEDRDLERTHRVGPETFQSVGSAELGAPVVASLLIGVGDSVQPGAGALVTRPDGVLQAVVNINEIDIPRIEVGQKAVITLDALPDQEFTGEVTEVSTGLVSSGAAGATGGGTANVVTFPVTVRLDAPSAQIKAGMSADAQIVLTTVTGVLAVPTGAVQEKEGTTIVLVPGAMNPDGTQASPEPLEVVVGLRSDDMVEVTSGLSEGQTIIVGLDVESLELPSGGLFSPPDGPPGSGDEGGP
ncbi:MAG: HlyD family efflux transporter periplasmic adaptor subunit [Actinobacteria bacterium]|nr:HlyD family efflux transporter periplasmic adaptor subunit [Actinomycetota bacterium]